MISIGNTGCGKSTLLGALIVGSSNMRIIKLENDNKKKIDYKPDVEYKPFTIGHGVNSETFYPKFEKSPCSQFYFADVAGLYDNNG